MEVDQFAGVFQLLDKRLKMDVLKVFFQDIPIPERYGIFRIIYADMEYNFINIDQNFLIQCLHDRFKSVEHKKAIQQLKQTIHSDIITIYRGEGRESSPSDEAYSWTLSETVADYFANRFKPKGKVYEAKVRVEDVIDYITHRDEEEILVTPSCVRDVKEKK
ncbi:hypothetical protein NDK43_25945 [Neobacillus pocheonensis]|uniref:Uncharacterized protein n=1 Tax=Neobacillus pocheonensis TaxID=363869 RepID=A0ABT0WFR3_9BACI|nr:hypothetical protein [Neobacillus pocheonensis]